MVTDIKDIVFDRELSPGAHNAVNVCLKLKPDEKITIITDNECLEIAASLVSEIQKTGSKYNLFVLEDYVARPTTIMPEEILEDLATSQVSIFCAMALHGELSSRIQMTSVVDKFGIRHGHMVNINKQIMMEGMRADFYEVDEISTRLINIAKKTKVIKAVSKGGTDITVHFSPDLNWIKTSGLISTTKWGNLPGGEIFTSPYRLDGRFVVDGVVGDYLCEKYGDLYDTPLYIDIVNTRITHMECDNKELLEEFTAYTMTDENSNRVGEFAIGTNLACKKVIGHILQDEKLPSIHIAFGHPYSKHTGQNWVSTTHIDCVGTHFDIMMDDKKVMQDGKFLI
jgi:leucyl aminopeptidase (aminopeptidase T)